VDHRAGYDVHVNPLTQYNSGAQHRSGHQLPRQRHAGHRDGLHWSSELRARQTVYNPTLRNPRSRGLRWQRQLRNRSCESAESFPKDVVLNATILMERGLVLHLHSAGRRRESVQYRKRAGAGATCSAVLRPRDRRSPAYAATRWRRGCSAPVAGVFAPVTITVEPNRFRRRPLPCTSLRMITPSTATGCRRGVECAGDPGSFSWRLPGHHVDEKRLPGLTGEDDL